MMRQRRPRPEALSDDVLTAATKASHARLAGMACATNLNNENPDMQSFLNLQLNSGVKVDVREAFEKQMALAVRASKWIHDKSVDQKFVTIGQLASFLKVKKECVPDIIKTIYPANVTGNEDKLIQLFIFVANNQIPQWLRPLISKTMVYRILRRAQALDNNTIMGNLEFKAQLYALPDFKENLVRVWEHGRNSIARALYTMEFTQSCNFDVPVEAPWMNNPVGSMSNIRPGFRDETTGIEWILDYASTSFTQLDKLNFNPEEPPILNMSVTKGRHTTEQVPDADLSKALVKVQGLVNWMQITNYTLRNITFAMNAQHEFRSMLVFVGNSGMGEKISVILPYKNLRFDIVK